MKHLLSLALLLLVTGCASFESRFTSQTGCPEEEIRVLKRSNNLIGNQSYTVACRQTTYYCTESFIEKQHSNLRCAADKQHKRRPSSSEGGDGGEAEPAAAP